MRACLVLLLLSGCTDYSKLSSGTTDGGVDDTDGGAVDGSPRTTDLAGIDFAGVDLADVDFTLPPEEDGATTSPDMTFLPASCKDVNDANPASNDGNFQLYYNHSAAKPWVAYCKGMGPGGAALEFLTLPQGSAANQSVIGADLPIASQFTKVRINPATLEVDVTNMTYGTMTGTTYGCTSATGALSIQYAYTLQYCGNGTAPGSALGRGYIDLRGTPFSVAQSAFTFVGGSFATYSNNNQTVLLTAPANGDSAKATGNKLQLVYP